MSLKQPSQNSKPSMKPTEIPGFEYLHSDVILIPGFRASTLWDQERKKRVWLDLKLPFLPCSKESIDLPLDIIKNEPDRLIADGILTKILWTKYYDSLITHLKTLEKSYQKEESVFTFHTFSYDWRRTNEASVETFVAFVQKIYDKNGRKPVYVICHSNGGLIMLSSLHLQPHLFAGAIFAGTPFHGIPRIFLDLKMGYPILFNKRLQDVEAIFALRPEFGFLPWNLKAFKDHKTGEDVIVDYFDIDTWLKNDWTDIIQTDTKRSLELGTREERITYLKRVLADSKRFYETLKCKKDDYKYPPLAILVNDSHDTNGGLLVEQTEDGKISIFLKNQVLVKGDGTVTFENAQLPEGIPYQTVMSKNSHRDLLEDLEAVGKAIEKVFNSKI
ncbi:hypothetical protein G9A89_019219 [Geosiphon pyriformis]|nr:hypothetical protein G9A89_019219 [Geosiphon pyriformis]